MVIKKLSKMLLNETKVYDNGDLAWTMVQAQGDFPSQVNSYPVPAVLGDFADTNPRASVLAGPGGLIAGAAGVTVGRFAWWNQAALDSDNAPALVNNFGSGPPTGFVHREQQALITQYLASAGLLVPSGFAVTLMSAGSFWVVNSGTAPAVLGMYAFADFATGLVSFGAGGTVGSTGLNNTTLNGSIGPQSSSFNGIIQGNVLTALGTATQFIPVGATIASGTAVPSGCFIIAQLSGNTGSAGGATYALNLTGINISAAIAMTATYGLLTAGTVTGATLQPGDILTATGTTLTANTQISALGTGQGFGGTYYLNQSQTVSIENMTVQNNIQTKWVCMSPGGPGALVKLSTHLLG